MPRGPKQPAPGRKAGRPAPPGGWQLPDQSRSPRARARSASGYSAGSPRCAILRRPRRKVPSSCPSRCSCCSSSTTRPRPPAGSRRRPAMPGRRRLAPRYPTCLWSGAMGWVRGVNPPQPEVGRASGNFRHGIDKEREQARPAGVGPECSRGADRMVSHPAGRDGRVIPSQVPAHDGARRIDRRAPSAWEERSGLMSQAARSARSVAGAGRGFSPAGTSGARAGLRCAGRADYGFRCAYQLIVDVPEGADRPAQGGHRPSGTSAAWPPCRCHCDYLIRAAGQPGCLALSAGRSASVGFGSSVAAGIVVIRFRTAVSLEVVLADVQLEKRSVRKAEPAERAGRGQSTGHVVLL